MILLRGFTKATKKRMKADLYLALARKTIREKPR